MLAAMLDRTTRSAPRAAGRSSNQLGVSLKPAKPARPVGWLVVVAGLAGCSGVEPVAPYNNLVTDPAQIYTRLGLDYRVLTLSTDPACHCATWQLTATPRDALDSAMANLPAPTFRPLIEADTMTVKVTGDGLVTALQPGTTQILVELAVGNVRHADTAFIAVNNPSLLPVLASVSADPLLSDSAIRPLEYIYTTPGLIDLGISINETVLVFFGGIGLGADGKYPLIPRALDTMGESITELAFDFEALDPAIATVTPASDRRTATWHPVSPGQARFVVRTTAYGVTVENTTVVTVTLPVLANVLVQPQPGASSTTVFAPQEVHIRPNGMVFWSNRLDHPVEVTFDDPTDVLEAPAACTVMDVAPYYMPAPPHCATGNFTLAAPPPTAGPYPYPIVSTAVVRRFPMVGVYTYQTSTGATGRVVVE